MNYIEVYYGKINNGDVVVSEKVAKLFKHLHDKLDDNNGRYIFDEQRANHAIDFIERYCKHSKGKWAGKPVILEVWQKAILSALFGFVDKDTRLRQYRELILIVARKNGKSTLSSGIGLYLLFVDGEAGPEIYSVATKRDQAKIIWLESKRMVKKSPSLAKRSKSLVSEIQCNFNDGTFKALASDSDSLDGLNVHGALIDELHAIKDKNLYDVVIDGMTAREQPLSIITSTAGTVREGIFDLKYEEATNIIDGFDDEEGYKVDTILPVIYELDRRNEWTNPKYWAKANPHYVKNLLCKDFNVRETATEAFLTFEQLNNEATFDIEILKPRYGIGGIDLSATTDLTCATMLFKTPEDEKRFYVEQMYWIPEELLEKRIHEDKVPYDIWLKRGFVRVSPGNSIDYRLIVEWFEEMQNEKDIYLFKCGYDSWSAKYFVQDMINTFGEPTMEPVIQGKKTLSGPMKALGADLEAKLINYNNNPVLKWCMANVSVDMDKNGNIQPCKLQNPRQRIDGFASLLDAYVVYERNKDDYMNII